MRDAACCRAATLCDGVGDGDGDGVASPTLIGGTRGGEEGEIKELHCGGVPLVRRRRERTKWLSDRSGKQICTKFNACRRKRRNGRTDETHTRKGRIAEREEVGTEPTARMQMDRPSIHRSTAQIDASTDSLSLDS